MVLLGEVYYRRDRHPGRRMEFPTKVGTEIGVGLAVQP